MYFVERGGERAEYVDVEDLRRIYKKRRTVNRWDSVPMQEASMFYYTKGTKRNHSIDIPSKASYTNIEDITLKS